MTTTQLTKLDIKEEQLVNIMQLLGDKTRYKIFKLLLSEQELCVSEIAERVGVSTPAISQHFKMFELNGLIEKHRLGQKICYELKANSTIVERLTKFIKR